MSSLLWSPKWLAAHLLVLVTVVGFAGLGLWQLGRLEERRATNTLIRERMTQPPVPFAEVNGFPEEAASYRRVSVRGAYEPAAELLLTGRSRAGRPGFHLLTPLVTPTGRLVVDRGWVPLEWDEPPVRQALPPVGEVELTGVLLPGQESRGIAGSARPAAVPAVDLEQISAATGEPLFHHYLSLQTQQPPQQGDLPAPPEIPALSEGPHLSYAVQWFLFAAIVVISYPLLLRKVSRDRTAGDGSHPPTGDPPGPRR